MRILKIHLFAQFKKCHMSGTVCGRKVKFLQTGFFTLFYPQAKFGKYSRTRVDLLQEKYKLSVD